MLQAIADLSLSILQINVIHADVQATLPAHHRDPFDRLLAAQAIVEQMLFVSADPVFQKYGVPCIW
jgi:PIN domain nuclease of toxin-antitoxin system